MVIHKKTRLTPLQRKEIYRRYYQNSARVTDLARESHVSRLTIYKIIRRGRDRDFSIHTSTNARYRCVKGSHSTSDRTFLPAVLRVLDKAYGVDGALRGLRAKRRAQAYQYLCAAWMAADRNAYARAFRLFARGVFRWPWSPGFFP